MPICLKGNGAQCGLQHSRQVTQLATKLTCTTLMHAGMHAPACDMASHVNSRHGICRCLDLLLSISYEREATLQQMLEAGIMPVIINALTACTHALQQGAALHSGAQQPPDSNDDTPGPAPTYAAALAALTICEVTHLCYRPCRTVSRGLPSFATRVDANGAVYAVTLDVTVMLLCVQYTPGS